jgi:predicted TIM-barrel fold metal-dependent hydrolase
LRRGSIRPWDEQVAHQADCIRRWGADRVLFGTDYPMWAADKELATLLSMDFTEEEFRRILWDNAYNLFVK